MNIGELFIALGFDVDDKKLKEFKEDLKGGLEGLLKISAAAAATTYGIDKFIEGAINSASALRDINLETGLSTEALQRWQNVISTSDPSASVEQVRGSIRAIQEAIAQAKFSGKDPHAFAMLGISGFMNMDANEVMDALRKAYKQHPSVFGDKTFLASLYKDLGIQNPASLISAFKLSDSDFNQKWNLPITEQEQIQKNVAFGNSISMLSNRLQYMREQLTAQWAPTLIDFLDRLTKKIPEATKDIREIAGTLKQTADGVNALGDYGWAGLAAGLTSLGVVIGVIAPETVVLAAALAGIAFSLKEIGEYMSQPGHNWHTWFGDAGWVLSQVPATTGHYAANGARGGMNALNDAAYNSMDGESKRLFNVKHFASIMSQPFDLNPAHKGGALQPVQNTFHNLYQIHSVEDAFAIANQIGDVQTRQLNQARQQINAAGQ